MYHIITTLKLTPILQLVCENLGALQIVYLELLIVDQSTMDLLILEQSTINLINCDQSTVDYLITSSAWMVGMEKEVLFVLDCFF